MSDDKKRVLIVDDSPEDIQFVMENLKDKYAVLVATSGEKALELAANEPRPEVILMDVMMPDMDGYETCRELKSNLETQDIDVIFVSANNTTDEKLAGYDAGGSDYLIKPVDPLELSQKVELALVNRKKRRELESDKTAAFDTAMTAMISGGELGTVLEFLRGSFTATSTQGLAQMVINALSNYSLKGSVQIRSQAGQVNLGMEGSAAAIEQELMFKLHDAGRILEQGPRLFINFGDITLLVKNLPVDDPDKCGRVRDNLAILMEGAESKLGTILVHQHNEEVRAGLQKLVLNSKQALLDIESIQRQHKEENVKIADSMLHDLEQAFLSWGLSEDQEQRLISMVQTGIEKSFDHYEKGLAVDDMLQNIIKEMSHYAE
jgi:DNA-binding response OmpR family regulator